jgi:glycosyltransferase involved in cell wall biosynthesis
MNLQIKKIKILWYCNTYPPSVSGYAKAFFSLISTVNDNLDDMYEVIILTPEKAAADFSKSQNIIEINNQPAFSSLFLPAAIKKMMLIFLRWVETRRKVIETFDEMGCDILFVETFDNALPISFLPRRILNRTVVRIHAINETESAYFLCSLKYKLLRFAIERLSKKIRYIFSTSQYHIDFCITHFLKGNLFEAADKIFCIVPNCLPSLGKGAVSLMDSPLTSKRLFVTLGMLDWRKAKQKGFDDLLHAISLLSEDDREKFDLVFIGQGDQRDSFIKKSEILGIGNIKFVEKMSNEDVIRLLNTSDVVVLPSRFEGQSVFVTEALSSCNAVILSDTGGLAGMVDLNGYLFQPQNILQLADAIKAMINISDHSLLEMKDKSRQLYLKKFSPEEVAKKFDASIKIVSADIRSR